MRSFEQVLSAPAPTAYTPASEFGAADLEWFPLLPFTLSSSSEHGIRAGAPGKGEHTESLLSQGWSEIDPAAEFPPDTGELGPESVLGGVTVVELCGSDCSAAGVGRLLADMGARVFWVFTGQQWAERGDPAAVHLTAGKQLVKFDMSSAAGLEQLHGLLDSADVLLTNLSEQRLIQAGVGWDVAARRWPRLVYCWLTNPWHPECCALGMLACSGMASVLSGGGSSGAPPLIPGHLCGLLASMYGLAAVSCGLFHQARTGEGQLCHVDLERVGAFLNQLFTAMCWKDRNKLEIVKVPHDQFAEIFPVPTFASFQTRDGVWVQLLGVDLPRHLPIVLRTLGLRSSVYPKAGWALISSLCRNFSDTNFFRKMFPVFRVINTALAGSIGKRDWADLHALFENNGVWHNPVRTPEQLHSYEQAHAIGAFQRDSKSGKVIVQSPVFVHPV